ncbi:hypothetical protein BpHYR1_026565 [Brachionus plicatilis]|uniref:Uncharacterized protein n=1 Tax=Brachionus plicatilis TaxID=10195 RepID=A0A3M7R6F6_BRAPC|nr:hypothetical protein BpHYR1_026565 [Brachionus plicatilis]
MIFGTYAGCIKLLKNFKFLENSKYNHDPERNVKTFMLKLQENSDIWQIYWIRRPKNSLRKFFMSN